MVVSVSQIPAVEYRMRFALPLAFALRLTEGVRFSPWFQEHSGTLSGPTQNWPRTQRSVACKAAMIAARSGEPFTSVAPDRLVMCLPQIACTATRT